jgi:hypothetical protein
MTVAEQIRQDLMDMVQKHDYSHMFSDSHNVWQAGYQIENQIKAKIHSLFIYHREDMTQLYQDCLEVRPEQYTDGLTHKTIKGWFNTYING